MNRDVNHISNQKIENLDVFNPISLRDMNDVALMKRVDTKFIVHKDLLSKIIENVKSDYKILQIGENRVMTYISSYFDTAKLAFYQMHHNGIAHRIKIRIRNYVESNLFFLEVKQKNSQGKTVKTRIKINAMKDVIDHESEKFISETTGQHFDLNKSLENSFNRFTLVNTERKERVSFDINLSFNNNPFNKDLVVIELKQESLNRASPIFKVLKNFSIYPYSISKYCIGMASNNKELKQNRFKMKFLKINKLSA